MKKSYLFDFTLVFVMGFSSTESSASSDTRATADPPVMASKLWGKQGEHWSPASRLPDFSTAGYCGGRKEIPLLPVTANAADFGAKGDGVTDDTEALQSALRATTSGALLIPAGHYVLKGRLRLEHPGVVIRGEGSDRTVFVIPHSLSQLEGSDKIEELGVPKSNYSFGHGFLEAIGGYNNREIGRVVEASPRGSREIHLDSAAGLAPGDGIQIRIGPEPDLARQLFPGDFAMGADTAKSKYYMNWVTRVDSIDGNTVTIENPLRTDIRPEWKPLVYSFQPTLHGIGIEDLGFEFAGRPKNKHLLEEGFNAINLIHVADSWVRNIRIADADLGIKLSRCTWVSVENIEITAEKRPPIIEHTFPVTGHHALWVTGYSHHCLLQHFTISTVFNHDLSIEGFSSGHVFRAGRGVMLNFDHHGNAPYENLFTDIDVGDVRRIWHSSGRQDRMPHTAARPTFWNIRYDTGQLTGNPGYRGAPAPAVPDWPQINVIGLRGAPESMNPTANAWIEPLPNGVLPADLYLAQKKRRTSSPPHASRPYP